VSQRYRVLKDAKTEPKAVAGSIVYEWTTGDYGLSADDTAVAGVPHISVTLNSNGDYPFFTIPECDLEEIER